VSNLAKRDTDAIESALVQGDISKFTTAERVVYYRRVCESLKLNPLTQPFQYVNLSGRLVLYATKSCTEQLRKIHGVSIDSIDGKNIEGVYVVTARGRDAQGRQDCATGAVTIANLKGDALANALMKAETKAKRRLTLSLCGLGMLDESELDTIPNRSPGPSAPSAAELEDATIDQPASTPAARVLHPIESRTWSSDDDRAWQVGNVDDSVAEVAGIEVHEGETKGKKWTRYRVTFRDAQGEFQATTFSATAGAACKCASEHGGPHKVQWTTNDKGNLLLSIAPA
jgi:hypothetical protein